MTATVELRDSSNLPDTKCLVVAEKKIRPERTMEIPESKKKRKVKEVRDD